MLGSDVVLSCSLGVFLEKKSKKAKVIFVEAEDSLGQIRIVNDPKIKLYEETTTANEGYL